MAISGAGVVPLTVDRHPLKNKKLVLFRYLNGSFLDKNADPPSKSGHNPNICAMFENVLIKNVKKKSLRNFSTIFF